MIAEDRVVDLVLVLDGDHDVIASDGVRQTFDHTLLALISGMFDDLRIPASWSIEAVPASDGAPPGSRAGDVYVNGVRCRVPSEGGDVSPSDPAVLAHRVHEAVDLNRGSIMAPELAAAIHAEWAERDHDVALPSVSTFRDHLAALIDHRVNIDAAIELYRSLDDVTQAAATADDLFERSVSNVRMITVEIQLGNALFRAAESGTADSEDGVPTLPEMLSMLRDGLFWEYGLMVPEVEVALDLDLGPTEIRFRLNDLRTPVRAGVSLDEFFVNEVVERLSLLGLDGRVGSNPATGAEGAIAPLSRENVDLVARAGLGSWTPLEYVVLSLGGAVRRDAGCFVNEDHVRHGLRRLGLAFPQLVEAVEARVDIAALTRALRRLLNEQFGIIDLRQILEALLDIRTLTDDSPEITDEQMQGIRTALATKTTSTHVADTNSVSVVIVAGDIEDRLDDPTPIGDLDQRHLADAIAARFSGRRRATTPAVIMTRSSCRSRLHSMVDRELLGVAVLSYEDISVGCPLVPVGRVDVDSWAGAVQQTTTSSPPITSRYVAHRVHEDLARVRAHLELTDPPEGAESEISTYGFHLFASGHAPESAVVFDRLATAYPANPDYQRQAGFLQQLAGEYSKAIAAFDAAIDLQGDDVVSLVYRAEARVLRGDTQAALSDLERAVEADEPSPDQAPWVERAQLLLDVLRT